jgi:hypothetical protein
MKGTISMLLPENMATSVRPGYLRYALWQAVGNVSSAAGGVLAMQSLLYAVGLGAGAIPLAGAMNWIVKDGLGQLGGVWFASQINHRFDAEPKKYRIFAALIMDLSSVLEIICPMFPASFVVMASIANIGKNIGWMTASATRASIHRNLMLKENLGDITAKAASQSTACGAIGTGVGMSTAMWIGSTEPHQLLVTFLAFSAVHIVSIYNSLMYVSIHQLNHQRMIRICFDRFVKGKSELISPEEMVDQEQILLPFKSPFKHCDIVPEVNLDSMVRSSSDFNRIIVQRDLSKKYILNVIQESSVSKVMIAWIKPAEPKDLIESYYVATQICSRIDQELSNSSSFELSQEKIDDLLSTHVDSEEVLHFVDDLSCKGWNVKNTYLEISSKRLEFE